MEHLLLVLGYKAEDQQIQIGYQNETTYRFLVEGEITFNGLKAITLKGELEPGSLGLFGKIPFDQINDYPHFEMSLERHSNRGHEETIECKIKTKPKHFLKMSILPRWGNRPGRTYPLWQQKKVKNTLQDIPIPKISSSKPSNPTRRNAVIRDLSELAMFSRELDLHVDKLFENSKSVSPEVIFNKQMKTFQWFMDKARAMNIDRVFIIHGVGSGRLKNEISKRLEYDPTVMTFKNEHHPKYGFGATEVEFY